MLNILHYIFSAIILILAAYGMVTQNFEFQNYMLFFLALLSVVLGLKEFKKGQKTFGWVFVFAFLFALFVSIQGFLMS